jgi:hypothetical protein
MERVLPSYDDDVVKQMGRNPAWRESLRAREVVVV